MGSHKPACEEEEAWGGGRALPYAMTHNEVGWTIIYTLYFKMYFLDI
jgi:hypothetical protein